MYTRLRNNFYFCQKSCLMKVLGMGNALVDVIVPLASDTLLAELGLPKGSMQLLDVDRLEQIQQATAMIKVELASGGSAANTVHGLAALGLETGFVGSLGRDEFGEFFTNDLREKGIKPIINYSEAPTGRATAFVSPDSERTFGTFLGAAMELSADHLTADLFTGYDFLYIEGYLVQNHQLIEKAVQEAKKAGLKVALDLASYNVVEENREFLERLLKEYVDLVFANEDESRAISGMEPEGALRLLSEWCEDAVVKIGKEGSLILSEGELIAIDSIAAKAVDTSGAGDLYAAGYLFGKSKGLPKYQCGQIGSLISGKVIEFMGPKLPLSAWPDVLAKIKQIELHVQ